MLKFTLFFLCFVPWISQLYMSYLGVTLFLTLILAWLIMALIAITIPYLLKKVTKAIRIIMVMCGLASAVFVPLLYIQSIRIVFVLPIFLGIISLVVWITASGLSIPLIKDTGERFEHGKSLIIGLLPLVLFAIVFPQSNQMAYICFLGYLMLAVLWMFQWDAANFLTSLSVTGTIFVGTLFLGVMRDTVLTFLDWVYRVIIVNSLLGVISIIASIFLKNLPEQIEVRSIVRMKEFMKNMDENAKLGKLFPPSSEMTFSKQIIPWILFIILIIILVCISYWMINRIKEKNMEMKRREIVESIHEEYHLAEHIWSKVKGILKQLKLENLSSTREGRVRWMYRKIIQRMIQGAFHVSKSKTPLEVMKDLSGSEELIPVYNKVRYGEKKVTSDEYERAEREFKQVMEELKLKLIRTNKKDNS